MNYADKIISVTLLFLLWFYVNVGVAKSDTNTLNCHFDRLSPISHVTTRYLSDISMLHNSKFDLMKLVQKKQKHYLSEGNIIRYNSSLFNVETKFVNTDDKIKWQYSQVIGESPRTLDYVFFKNTNKINVDIKNIGEAWGKCEYLITQEAKKEVEEKTRKLADKEAKSAFSLTNCYEKEISYPKEMFGQFSEKQKKSIKKIDEFFKYGKDTLSEKPYRMLYGLAYLEILVNELCTDVTNYSGIEARKKIEKVLIDLRDTLGLPTKMKRTKIINIYWSTGKLLELAKVKKLNVKDAKLELIKKLREAKSELKRELKIGLDEK
ncbi:hypothetical protein OAK51_04195 [Alphaproteobacteria bacterium]|nr:hypothetical protein [Alphaproteobacteria bacterium]